MATLKEVLEIMTSSYSDLAMLARGQVVDANELAKAIKKADPDSAEMVALQALAKWNSVQESTQDTTPETTE